MPDAADPIPANVLKYPFVGEARRFDGAIAPAGWMLARGQTLLIKQNPRLYGILGTIAGGDGKTTFRLPALPFGAVVAVAGIVPASPTFIAQSGRHVSPVDSLGPGARPAPVRALKPAPEKLLADRALINSAVHSGNSPSAPASPEMVARIGQASLDAQARAVEGLNPANRSLLDAARAAYLEGRISLNDAATQMGAALTRGEADALLAINEATTRTFRPGYAAARSKNPQRDAARYLLSVAITQDQIAAASARGVELH